MAGFLDLTHPLNNSIPVAPILPGVKFDPVMSLADGKPNVLMCTMPSHCGTHVDAPRHFIADGMTIDDVPLDWLVGPACAIDFDLAERQEITAAMLDGAGGHVRRGDRLLVRTGFTTRYWQPSYVEHPYFTEDAAGWMIDRGIRLLGIDMLTPDKPHSLRDSGFNFPVHHILLGNDVIIVENLRFDNPLPERFDVSILPLPIHEGDGAPARAFAHVG
ncbi:cyclase family protein [Amycolatopsis alkalitolerans]|uniref:Cyclase family protein n=1 Tax=Amycolatopsis alkalitolerans TaxID=2547244 RepID=A0A5C4M4Q4_9PSEU|nr:cyclase family protein [Amycolatopsis alkalitolerans]TNC25152.1 cyclase family protein [Amycolatopsis alkalitolerans]